MRMAFEKFKVFYAFLKFIADGYSAYPASQQCKLVKGWDFDVTQVIDLKMMMLYLPNFVATLVERLTAPSNPLTVLLAVMEVRTRCLTAYPFGLLIIIFFDLIL